MSKLNTLEHKLDLAYNTNSISDLYQLMSDSSSNVRKAVAKNSSATNEILSILSYDPAANVSFAALSNPNCNSSRAIDEIEHNGHPCIICIRDIRKMNCEKCKDLHSYRNN